MTDDANRHKGILPRCKGQPTRKYARIAGLLYDLATEDITENRKDSADRLTGLHFILDAAKDALKLAMNTVADPDLYHPGRLSVREQAAYLGLSQYTIAKYIEEARALIDSDEYDEALQKARRRAAA